MEGAKARDLIGDIQEQHRRRLLRRAALVAALAVVLLLVGIVVKLVADGASRDEVLEEARARLAAGGSTGVAGAIARLEEGAGEHPDDDRVAGALALVRAHAWADLGEGEAECRAAVAAVEGLRDHDAEIARGVLSLADGDPAGARAAAEAADELGDEDSVAPDHEAWLRGAAALAEPGETAEGGVEEALEGPLGDAEAPLSNRRLHVALLVRAGRAEEALTELAALRTAHPDHEELAAEEALHNAVLRQHLAGVATVADQLLADPAGLGPRARARARLARAIVHGESGEADQALQALSLAWPDLPRWDMLARGAALELALAAHASELARAWARDAGLASPELEIVDAWAALSEGDVMGSLERLAALPQTHPRVAYLQGLALVEQRRFEEAEPWIARAEKLMPGRVELAVASARVQVHRGDRGAALARLRTLAEEEPYAPRAHTGLGEAYLAVEPPDRAAAQKAFERAVAREHRAAEAMLQLARLLDGHRAKDPQAPVKARELLEQAASRNPHLPRYRAARALYLAELGYRDAAIEALTGLVEEPGADAAALLTLCRLAVERAADREQAAPPAWEDWLAAASKAGATQSAVERERARAAVLTGSREDAAQTQAILAGLLQADAADVDARVLQSRAFLRAPAREEAVTTLRRALAVAPERTHGRLYLEWARIESRSGDRRKASAHARVAWSRLLEADRPPAELLEAAELTVRLFLRDQKPKPALQVARTLAERMPWHARALVIRGRAELSDGATKEALDSADAAIALDAGDPEAHELTGDAVLRFGYKDRAKQAYERAVALAPDGAAAAGYREKLGKL